MNLNPYNTTAYENKHDWTLGQNKPNSKPIQTQSNPILSAVGGLQMNVSISLQMAYENKHNWTLSENKPNSNPIKPNLVRRRRIAKIKTSNVITKDYENELLSCPKKQTQTNPISKQPPFYHFQKGCLGGIYL